MRRFTLASILLHILTHLASHAFLTKDALGDAPSPKIAWHGKLEDGIAEAKRSQRPILLVSAAPQCQNVPGMW